MEKIIVPKNCSPKNEQIQDFLRNEIDRLNESNTFQSKKIIHIEGEKSKLLAVYEQENANWRIEKSQFIAKEKKLKENHEKMMKQQTMNVQSDASKVATLNNQIKRYVEELCKSKEKYDTDIESFKLEIKEKDNEINKVLANMEKESDAWKAKEYNLAIEKDFMHKEIERYKENLEVSRNERIEEKNTFNRHNSEIKKVMQEQLEFIKQLQSSHSEQINKISSNSDKHYYELRNQYEDERNILLSSREQITTRAHERLEDNLIVLKNNTAVLENRLKKSQSLLKEKHDTLKTVKKENFELIEKNQKLIYEVKSLKNKIKERIEDTQIENLLQPTSKCSYQNEQNHFDVDDGDNISIEYIEDSSNDSEKYSNQKHVQRPAKVSPLNLNRSKGLITKDLNDSIRSSRSKFNDYMDKETELAQNISNNLSSRSRCDVYDLDDIVCIESEQTRPKTLLKSRNSVDSRNIERHLNLCSSYAGKINNKKNKVDYINRKKINDMCIKISDHKRSKSFNVSTLNNTLNQSKETLLGNQPKEDCIDRNSYILGDKLKQLEERMNRIETQNNDVNSASLAHLNMNIIKTSEFDDLMLTTTNKEVRNSIQKEQSSEDSDEKTKIYNMSLIESQVNSQLNKIELKNTTYKQSQNEKHDRHKKKPPICNTSNIKKNLIHDKDSSVIYGNTRLSNISIARSIDQNDRGFLNFYKENRNNSTFININNAQKNDYFNEDSM